MFVEFLFQGVQSIDCAAAILPSVLDFFHCDLASGFVINLLMFGFQLFAERLERERPIEQCPAERSQIEKARLALGFPFIRLPGLCKFDKGLFSVYRLNENVGKVLVLGSVRIL